jgi:hypothetical protein
VAYAELRINGEMHHATTRNIIDVIQDVAEQHESHLLWHSNTYGLVPQGARTIAVDSDGRIARTFEHGTTRSRKALRIEEVTFSKVCCSEHLKTAMGVYASQDYVHTLAVKNPDQVNGVAGEHIILEGDLCFANPANQQFKMRACRHCGAYLFKTESAFCCNNGKNTLHSHHFQFWSQLHRTTCPAGVDPKHKAYFEQCGQKVMKHHSRLCNNTLAFTMLKHESIHGTAHELDPQYYPWMMSIQGRTYHTYLSTPQPYNNVDKPQKRLNNNIGWYAALIARCLHCQFGFIT